MPSIIAAAPANRSCAVCWLEPYLSPATIPARGLHVGLPVEGCSCPFPASHESHALHLANSSCCLFHAPTAAGQPTAHEPMSP